VREYWIVDPRTERVSVIFFEDTEKNAEYKYEDVIQSFVLDGFEIRIADFIDKYNE
jgi:Uma2 family endonuclease